MFWKDERTSPPTICLERPRTRPANCCWISYARRHVDASESIPHSRVRPGQLSLDPRTSVHSGYATPSIVRAH
jgi:hypothetical protein